MIKYTIFGKSYTHKAKESNDKKILNNHGIHLHFFYFYS